MTEAQIKKEFASTSTFYPIESEGIVGFFAISFKEEREAVFMFSNGRCNMYAIEYPKHQMYEMELSLQLLDAYGPEKIKVPLFWLPSVPYYNGRTYVYDNHTWTFLHVGVYDKPDRYTIIFR